MGSIKTAKPVKQLGSHRILWELSECDIANGGW